MNEEMNYNGGINKKKGNVIIVCLTMIILALIGSATVVLLNNNNKDTKKDDKANKETKQEETTKQEEKEKSKYTKIDETKGYYYIEKGKSYTGYASDGKINLSFSYPVINSKTDSATKANNEIKEFVNKTEKKLISKDNADAGGCNVLIINGKKRNVLHTFEIEHELYEINKLINIQLNDLVGNACGGSGVDSIKSYFISKETGEVLNNEDIVKSFGYKSETLVNAYNSYLKDLKNRHKEDFDEYKSVSNINELELAISENKKLSVIGPAYGNAIHWYLEFDGAKLFVKDADFYADSE